MAGMVEGNVVMISGAASGIGREAALLFAAEGAKVLAVDRDEDGLDQTAESIGSQGGTARARRCDVTSTEDLEAAVAECMSAFGGLHCAFNSAGVEGPLGRSADCSEEDWRTVIDVNLTGTWLAMRAQLRHMAAHGGGAIVNVASVAGLVGSAGMAAYTASKHGVVGLTKTAALDYSTKRIRVNAVCPGVVATPMIDRITSHRDDLMDRLKAQEPMGRLAEPQEVAQCALWLCSDRASYVTGHAMTVDGGFVAR